MNINRFLTRILRMVARRLSRAGSKGAPSRRGSERSGPGARAQQKRLRQAMRLMRRLK